MMVVTAREDGMVEFKLQSGKDWVASTMPKAIAQNFVQAYGGKFSKKFPDYPIKVTGRDGNVYYFRGEKGE